MKKCPNCHADVNDNFEICWNCQYSFIECRVLQNSDFELICPNCNSEIKSSDEICSNCNFNLSQVQAKQVKDEMDPEDRQIDCLRCNVNMDYKGDFSFHEGTTIGKSSLFFDLFTNRVAFDLYVCPNCGKAEFFIPGF